MPSAITNSRETFLHYLADNLPGLTVHNLRIDKNNPKLNEIMLNSVNVSFHNSDFSGPSGLSQTLVTVDLVYDKETDAISAGEQVSRLLFMAAYAPLMDYTVPASPVQVGKERMFWSLTMKFKPVHSENFYHMSALLHLNVHFA